MTVHLFASILPEAATWGALLTTAVFGPTLARYTLMRHQSGPTTETARPAVAAA